MHEFTIVKKEFYEGEDAEGKPFTKDWYTFLVDGFPSLKWFRACEVQGLSPTYYVDRCINRLKAGKSREAFGGIQVGVENSGRMVVMGETAGRGIVYQDTSPPEVSMVNGKRREKRKGFKFSCDGVEASQVYPSEQAARAACAIHCFMTRSKLGCIPKVLLRLKEEYPNGDCKVWACKETNGIRAMVGETEYLIAWLDPSKSGTGQWEVEKFKQITSEVK